MITAIVMRKAVARERSVGSPSSQAMDLYMSSTLPVVSHSASA